MIHNSIINIFIHVCWFLQWEIIFSINKPLFQCVFSVFLTWSWASEICEMENVTCSVVANRCTHLLTCREAEQPHAKNCTVAENCTETLHHVFCTFEAEEFIYLVLFFILLRTKQQQVIWQKYSCLIMFENLIKKNMLKISGSSFSAERRFYI